MFVIFHVEQNILIIIWLIFPLTGTPERGTCIITRKKVIATKFVFLYRSIDHLPFTRLLQSLHACHSFFCIKNHHPPAVNIIKLQSHKRKQLLAALINTLNPPPPTPSPTTKKNKRKNKTKLPPPQKKNPSINVKSNLIYSYV